MFTGIIEEMGTVVSLETAELDLWDGTRGPGVVLTISCVVALEGAYIGCSIAVNGVCLTATGLTATTFTVNCAPETLRVTALGSLAVGEGVNLERGARVDGRNSGHYVQGHVDGTGEVAAFWREGDSLWVRIAAGEALLRYIVPKGFVAVDGTSLTVCEVARAAPGGSGGGGGSFTLMLIAHTQRHIVLPRKAVGARVNLEVDVVGKLVERSAGGLSEAVEKLGARLEGAVGRLEARLEALEARVGGIEQRARQEAV
jgi:riboflavin synthase